MLGRRKEVVGRENRTHHPCRVDNVSIEDHSFHLEGGEGGGGERERERIERVYGSDIAYIETEHTLYTHTRQYMQQLRVAIAAAAGRLL
jgi:hypothetical protein